MHVIRALALACVAYSCGAGAQDTRENLFGARDRAFAERSEAQAGLDAASSRLAALPADMSRYQIALDEARVHCTATFTDPNAYAQRQAECRRRSAELDAWRARLEGGSDAILAEAEPLQARVDAANATIADLDRRIRALGPSTQLEREMVEARRLQQSQVDSLRSEIQRIVVPNPPNRIIHEGVILGIMSAPDQVDEIVSPFSNCGNALCTYDQLIAQGRSAVYSFGDQDILSESLRALLDNRTYALFTLSTPHAQAIVREMNGLRFERLLAHSNGATIAEALIRERVITVDELNILGGDRSLANTHALQQLIDSGQVRRVRIWLNQGDPIPAISSSPLSWPLAREAAYWAGVLTGQNQGGDARVEVCFFAGGSQRYDIEQHYVSTYLENMRSRNCH